MEFYKVMHHESTSPHFLTRGIYLLVSYPTFFGISNRMRVDRIYALRESSEGQNKYKSPESLMLAFYCKLLMIY